jgi:uncharacterized protein YbcV (DUF1398 family)
MFTAEQIEIAHNKVKSGTDFPSYIKEIKAFGVTGYDAYVTDGHIDYHGANGHTSKVPAKYEKLTIAQIAKPQEFKAGLVAHQEGKTTFMTFIKLYATVGIARWKVCMDKMTCAYYDKEGQEILVEEIPQD